MVRVTGVGEGNFGAKQHLLPQSCNIHLDQHDCEAPGPARYVAGEVNLPGCRVSRIPVGDSLISIAPNLRAKWPNLLSSLRFPTLQHPSLTIREEEMPGKNYLNEWKEFTIDCATLVLAHGCSGSWILRPRVLRRMLLPKASDISSRYPGSNYTRRETVHRESLHYIDLVNAFSL